MRFCYRFCLNRSQTTIGFLQKTSGGTFTSQTKEINKHSGSLKGISELIICCLQEFGLTSYGVFVCFVVSLHLEKTNSSTPLIV